MKKIFEILWFTIIYYRVLWHNRKYDDFMGDDFMGADLSCGKDIVGITIYLKDDFEEGFNMFEISKTFSRKYYDGYIRKGFEHADFTIERTNYTINPYVDSTFSNRKLVVKHLKSYNLI